MSNLKGIQFNVLNDFFGTSDPDIPNLSPKELKELWDAAKPKLLNFTGKVIIISIKGEFDKNYGNRI